MWGCTTAQSYSNIPEIKFKDLNVEDLVDPLGETFKTAILTFSFVDGDGDIGSRKNDEDKISKVYYTWYKQLTDGTFDEYRFPPPGNEIEVSSEIPFDVVMDKSQAQNKVLKGTIEIKLSTPRWGLDGIDIMYVEFYIKDRAGNESNRERSPEFSIKDALGIIQ